jgi:hypothetical protein
VGNDPPEAALDSAPILDSSGFVPVTYTLYDSTSDVCTLTVEFSTDGGTTFDPAAV